MHIVTKGLVLREVNYKESDKILTVLTAEGGKRTVKARGCRKKNSPLAASSQLLVWSDMTLFEYQDYYTLNDASSLEQFWNVKGDMEKLALGSYFAEVMEAVAEEGQEESAMLSLILNSLYALDQLSKPQALVKAAYELKLMCLAGYEPLLEGCGVCGAEEAREPRLHLREGVVHCEQCREGLEDGVSMPLDGPSLRAMQHIAYGDPKRLFSVVPEGESLQRLADACEAYLLTQLERGFRTLDFYKSLRIAP